METTLLAFCRAGLDTEQIIAVLSAITSRMRADDPACIALDKCNDTLMDLQEQAREADLWAADDVACKRAQSLGPASSIPGFPRPNLSFLSIMAKEPA